MLRFLLWWCKHPWPWRPLALPPVLPFESAADVFGEGNACGVGGWLRVGSTHCFWFSERFTPADFRSLGIPVKDDANLDISSYETLAQGFLLVLLLRTISGGRLRVRLPALSDKVGAENVINRLYTSKQPLALFVQRLAMWACARAISLACSHIAGEKNVEADALSRWDESCPIPHSFGDGVRVRISLTSFLASPASAPVDATRHVPAAAAASASRPVALRRSEPNASFVLSCTSRCFAVELGRVLILPSRLGGLSASLRAGLPASASLACCSRPFATFTLGRLEAASFFLATSDWEYCDLCNLAFCCLLCLPCSFFHPGGRSLHRSQLSRQEKGSFSL